MTLPMTTPTRRGSSTLSSASRAASIAAATPKWTSLAVRRTSLALIAAAGSKPFTSAAMLTGKASASNARMTSTPLRPDTSASHVEAASFPTGVTAPTPVMTTRLIGRTDGGAARGVAPGPARGRRWRLIAQARYTVWVSSQSQTQRHRLTAQSLERMREGIRKRAEALGRDHEQRFAEVGRMVADNRIERGMSQQELAVLCGTTQSAIARLERGGRPPKLDTLMRIADALDADLLLEMRLRPRETE